MASLRSRNELAYQALGFMGQAGYSEEADGVLPLCTTTWGDDKLLRAALAGRRGGPPPAHGWRGRTRLMAACHFSRLPRVSLLLTNGAPLEQRDAFGGTAMAAALVAGRSAVMSALASAGAGPYTPLTGTASSTLQVHTSVVSALAVLPDGLLASGSWDRTVRVWRPSTDVCEAVLKGHTDGVFVLTVLPDGRLASASWDKTVRVWRPSTGVCEAVLKGHTDGVFVLTVLPDGRHASGSWDRTVRVWRPSTGVCEAVPEGHTREVYALAVLPDGRLASASEDKTVRVWS